MSTFGEFSATIDRFQAKLSGRNDKLVQHCAFEILESVSVGNQWSPGTPIDTSNAVNHWWVRIGPEGDAAVSSDAKKVGPATAVLDEATFKLVGAKAGDFVYILNNAAYIKSLEYGHSKQAPAGFIRITAAQWQRIVDKIARLMINGE